jgi:hypothetical protein
MRYGHQRQEDARIDPRREETGKTEGGGLEQTHWIAASGIFGRRRRFAESRLIPGREAPAA